MIRIPAHSLDTLNRVRKVSRTLVNKLGRMPSLVEVASEMGDVPLDRIKMLVEAGYHPISLENPVHEDGDFTIGDTIISPNVMTPEDEVADMQLKQQIEEVLASLTVRQREVLRLRFGLGDGQSRTLEEVGKELGVTRERVRQIEAGALNRLNRPEVLKRFEGYLGDRN